MKNNWSQEFKKFNNWEEAIHQCGELLINEKYIEPEYLDAIIASTNKFGPYYVVADYVAIAHAEVDEKIIHHTGYVWNYIHEPVQFSPDGGKPVKHLIVLCSRNAEEHQSFLVKFAQCFMDETKKKLFYEIQSKEQLDEFLNKNFSWGDE
jgi:PTS system ascorbate-specific IIA component